MQAVYANSLSKVYDGGKRAVDNVSFEISAGSIFGFLGPNGAGKTTAIKLLSGMLSPSAGSCEVFGIDPALHPEKVHQIAGVVTEHAQMYGSLTGLENLMFYASLFGMGRESSQSAALGLLGELGLADAKGKKLETYSTGMRQRLSLARAMIHSPKILFLDEPTSGLDPESALSVNNMIKSLAESEGATVFICTHQLRYAQEICTSYGLIDNGSLLALGSLDELRELVFPGMRVSIKASKMAQGMQYKTTGEMLYEMDVSSEQGIAGIVSQIVSQGGSVYSVMSRQLSLEEIYFALIERRNRKEGPGNA
ncbi:MAG: ABC transporter ATP-binding protein [Eubacteriaceae bacterium]|nr:ABC transporter ATP-binding protein [Eubacteriaceae bacterium]